MKKSPTRDGLELACPALASLFLAGLLQNERTQCYHSDKREN